MTRQVALAADQGALAQDGGLVQVPSRQRYARYVGRVGALAVVRVRWLWCGCAGCGAGILA